MATQTTNYGFTKPDVTEYYNVQVQNGNMDLIDSELKKLSDAAGNISNLNTEQKTSLVAAVNELLTKIGALSSLTTTEKSNLVAAVNEIREQVMSHLADLVSESIVVTRDLTLSGIQRVTTSKKPKAITLIASQYNSKSIHGYCSENGDQGCNYRTNNGEIGDTNLAILAGDSLDNRTDGQISNITDTGFDINWSKIGTGATGTLTIRILVIYHGKGVV